MSNRFLLGDALRRIGSLPGLTDAGRTVQEEMAAEDIRAVLGGRAPEHAPYLKWRQQQREEPGGKR